MIPVFKQLLLAVSGSHAAWIVVKATIILTLALAGASFTRKSRAALRHTLLAAAFGAIVALPLLSTLTPPMRLVLPAVRQSPAPPPIAAHSQILPFSPDAGTVPASPSGLSLSAILWMVWGAGAALFLAPVLVGIYQVHSLRRSALLWPHGHAGARPPAFRSRIRRHVGLLLHEDLAGPMTCGVIRPVIILPRDAQTWDASDLDRAVVHELEHVRRADWIVQCAARAVCAFYWFHPLVWMAWRKLTLEAERSCDDAVLGGSEATAYAGQLVALAQRLSSRKSPLLAMANRSDLATRVGAVLDHGQQRGRAGVLAVTLASAFSLLMVLGISPIRVVAAPQSPAPQVNLMVRSNLVTVNLTVTDLAGNSIDGLGARDFVLTEDGVAQKISTFEYRQVPSPEGTLKSYYILGYYTSNNKADGQFRRIQVIDKNDSTAKVETRAGYYAPKPSEHPGSGTRVLRPATPLAPGATAPVLIFKREPEYSEAARQAKYQGSVILSLDVDENGLPANLKVVRSLGLGLDEKAIEAVKQWKFKPGTLNGQPVATPTQVEVEFRLL